MPKDRRGRSVSRDRFRASPYPCSSSHTKRPLPKLSSETEENVKEWEEVRCPVCLEHPHNAVLLICSSYEKGCRPYMCDTSYRHSNCLDQYCKSFSEEDSPTIPPEGEGPIPDAQSSAPESMESTIALVHNGMEEEPIMNSASCDHQTEPKLLCPLCRGEIKDWIIVEPARCFMNSKSRNCSCEACSFSGTYADLRKHARLEHPQARPSEADPERQRTWRSLERQRDIGDLFSTLQSSMGEDRVDDGGLPLGAGWIFLIVRVVRPGSSSRSSSWSGSTRTRAQISIRRRTTRLWGESYEGEAGSPSGEEDNESSDGGSGARRHNELADGGTAARTRNESSDGGLGVRRHNETSDGGTGARRRNESSDAGSSARGRNESSDGGTGVRRRNESSDGGTVVRRRSERLRRRTTPENQP